VIVLLAVRFIDESTGFLAPASVENFRADLGMGYTAAGAMFVSYGIGGMVGNLAVVASDGKSRKPVTVGGALGLALAMLLVAAATNEWMVIAGTGLVAIGATGLVHGGEIAIANALTAAGEDHRLERTLAAGNLGAVAGDLAGPVVLAGMRAAGIGWRPVFVGAAVVVAGYAAVIASIQFPDPVHGTTDDSSDARPSPVRKQRLVWFLAMGAFVAMPLDESYLAVVLAFAQASLGWSGVQAAALGLAFVVGGIAAFGVLPPLIERTPLPQLMTAVGLGLSAVMLVAATGPGWTLIPVGVVHSTLLGSLWLGEQTAVLRANPGREGRTKMIVELLEGSALVFVFGAGALADRYGLRSAMVAFALLPLALPVIARAGRDDLVS
jgi:MFS family permease